MKSLPKSLRGRKRYLFCEVETSPDPNPGFDERDLQRSIWFAAQNLFGDLVSSKAELRLVEYEDGMCVVRTHHDTTKEARAALACVHEVQGMKTAIRVLGISGTLKAGREKYSVPELEQTTVDSEQAWKRGKRLDIAELDDDLGENETTGRSDRKRNKKDVEDTKFIGATVHDF